MRFFALKESFPRALPIRFPKKPAFFDLTDPYPWLPRLSGTSTTASAMSGSLKSGGTIDSRRRRKYEKNRWRPWKAFSSHSAQPVKRGPRGLYDSARAFSCADLKGDLEAIGALSGGFKWKDGGADSLLGGQARADFSGRKRTGLGRSACQAHCRQIEIPPGCVFWLKSFSGRSTASITE